MHKTNGTPATMTLEQERVDRLARLSPKRTVPTAALLRAYAEIDALRDAVHALTAKASALDALVEAAGAVAAGVRNDYPNPMWDGASVFVPMPRVVALESALTAAKLAQAQS